MATENKDVKNIYSKQGGAFIAGKGSCMTLKYSKTSDNKYYNLVIAINNTGLDGKFIKVDDAIDSGSFSLGSFEILDLTILLEAMIKNKNNNIYMQHVSKDGKGVSFEIAREGKVVNAFISYIEDNKVVKEYQFDFTRTEDKKLQFVNESDGESSDVVIDNYALLYFLNLLKASLFVTSNLFLSAYSLEGGGSGSALGSAAGASVSSNARRSRLGVRSTDNKTSSSDDSGESASVNIKSIADMLSDDE